MLAISTSEDGEDKSMTIMPGLLLVRLADYTKSYIILFIMVIADSEMASDASSTIVIPLVSCIMSTGVILLLLVVIALCVFMSKQIKNTQVVL